MSLQNKPLKRTLTLPLMVLYGLGTTIGAGIYALVGELASIAGYLAPASFLLAAFTAGLTAVSFAELSSRYPRAAGVALYIKQASGSNKLSMTAGLLVILAGVVSAAALVNGFIGYLGEFIQMDRLPIITIVCVSLGLLAAWGIAESVTIASIVTLVEIGGLLMVVFVSRSGFSELPVYWPQLIPSFDMVSWGLMSSGVFLAFYAFIGFEDMIDVAEEIKDVRHNLPRAIMLTLAITTLIYMLVMVVAILSMPIASLSHSDAPLAALYQHHQGGSASVITVIALFAIINGALIQLIMASRVMYGMASRGQLPVILCKVYEKTRTPIIATVVAAILIFIFAVIGRLAILAETTSVIMLIIFAGVNLSLIVLKRRDPRPTDAMIFPTWIPYLGFVVCSGFVLKMFKDSLI